MRHARIEISPTALRLLAVDARRNVLRATVDDALRVVALGTEAGISTSTPELRRMWIGPRPVWRYSVTIEPSTIADQLADELRSRGFSVRVEQARRGIVGA